MAGMGVPPHFDAIMGNLEQVGRLADFVDQVEHKCKLGDANDESLDELAADEGQITAGIEELLKKVREGTLFKQHHQFVPENSHNPRAKLKQDLTDAAGKEDAAKIVQDAGAIAEGHIKKTLAAGLAKSPPQV